MGSTPIRDCIGCNYCQEKGGGYCVFKEDMVNDLIDKAKDADGYIFASPVFYSHPTGQILSLMDRLFYASGKSLAHKPASAIVTARRAGASSSLDVITKHFTDNFMPVVSSTYWNIVHGTNPKECEIDEEGFESMRNLARNMAWMLKALEKREKPLMEKEKWTSFVH